MSDANTPDGGDGRLDAKALALSVFAGETVLGTAAHGERTAILDRFQHDTAFAGELRAWESRLAPLADLVPPVQPSPSLWPRIASATSAAVISVAELRSDAPMRAESDAPAQRVELPRAMPPSPTTSVEGESGVAVGLEEAIAIRTRHLKSRVARWRWATAAVTALAACLAAAAVLGPDRLGLRPSPPAAGQRFVGVVNSTGELPPLIVRVDTASGELTVEPLDLKPEAGKSFELWAIPPNAKPVSLGVVDRADRRSLQAVDPGAWKDPSLVLAVSVEPQGGSPTGQPTGPVVLKGRLVPAE
jgi:anti-sigma-K factor RskA